MILVSVSLILVGVLQGSGTCVVDVDLRTRVLYNLFTREQNELYTSMKQKTMDQELMATLNREAQEDERRRFEHARIAVGRLENMRKVIHGLCCLRVYVLEVF